MTITLKPRRRVGYKDPQVGELARDVYDSLNTLATEEALNTLQTTLEGEIAELEEEISTSVVPTSRTISAGAGLTGGGDLSADRTIAADFGSTAGTVCEGNDSRLSNSRTPTAHHTTHESGGSDSIKLDDLAAPDDNTDLDATTGHHGLLPKLEGTLGKALLGNGTYGFPIPTTHHATHESGGADSIKLDDLAAPDDNTDLNASASAHGLLRKLDSDTTHFLRGDGSWAIPAGSGGSSIFSADVPPTSPSSQDDEFPTGAINARWSTWDPATILTKSIDNHHLYLKTTGNSTDRWAGLYQAVPGSEFAIYTKTMANGGIGNFFEPAIFVSDNISSSPTTADFRTLEAVLGATTNSMFTRTWSAYNGSGSSSTNNNGFLACYMRLRCNGTACTSDFSLEGVNWLTLATITLGFTPTHMGLAFNNTTNLVTKGARFKFFRCFAGAGTSGFDATSIGGML